MKFKQVYGKFLAFFTARVYYYNMYKVLRIICSILSALCVAAAIFIFVYFSWWGFLCVGGALALFGLTLLFKRLQEKGEEKLNPPPKQGDFITGRVEKED